MKESKYKSQIATIMDKLNIWMLVALVAVATNFGQMGLIYILHSPEKTIIVPAEMTSEFWVQGDRVSPSYYKDLAEFFADKLLNYNSENAEGQFSDALRFAEPSVSIALHQKFQAALEEVKSKSLGSTFYLTQYKVHGSSVLLFGRKIDIMSDQIISQHYQGYKVDMTTTGGTIHIKGFQPVDMPQTGIDSYEQLLAGSPAADAAASGEQK